MHVHVCTIHAYVHVSMFVWIIIIIMCVSKFVNYHRVSHCYYCLLCVYLAITIY